MDMARVHLFIEGRVQGVFYRAFTRDVAARLGINGWVKNLYDGRVEAVFEGNSSLIEKAVNECKKGPHGSLIKEINIFREEYSGELKGFEIKY